MVPLNIENKIIAISPYGVNPPNQYIQRMIGIISKVYPNSHFIPLPRTRNLMALRKVDYLWLNWFEDLPKNNAWKSFLSKLLIIGMAKLMRVKIITTFHNRQSHESSNSHLNNFLFNLTFKSADKIIGLCNETETIIKQKFGERFLRKLFIIPPPTYPCSLKNINYKTKGFHILSMGYLRPYKNIELIFDLAGRFKDIYFTIAGKAINQEYETVLKKEAAKYPNVTLLLRYLSEQEIDELINQNDILLWPYDVNSSLNSGIVIDAMCRKINMILPSIGTVKHMKNKDNFFHYSYTNSDDHIINLVDSVNKAYQEFNSDKSKFYKRIEPLHSEIMEKQSPNSLLPKIKELFS